MEIDYDYLRTGTAIGFHAFHELCSNFLFCFVVIRVKQSDIDNGVYRMFALGANFASGFLCTVQPKNLLKIVKKIKILQPWHYPDNSRPT